jgi:hypothetical protein
MKLPKDKVINDAIEATDALVKEHRTTGEYLRTIRDIKKALLDLDKIKKEDAVDGWDMAFRALEGDKAAGVLACLYLPYRLGQEVIREALELAIDGLEKRLSMRGCSVVDGD